MFKNCVFKLSVDTKLWFKNAMIRCVKTMAQAAVTLIGSDMVNVVSLDWLTILGMCATMGLVSILTSVAGIPEVKANEE